MKRLIFAALVLVSALAFSFESKAQTLKKGTMPTATGIRVDDGLTTGERDALTTITTYTGSALTTVTGTSLPTSSSGCPNNSTIYACDLFVLIPSGKSATDAEIMTGLRTKLGNPNPIWTGCETEFSFTITPSGGSSYTATGKWFCKDNLQ